MTLQKKGLLFCVYALTGALFSYLFYLKPIGISLPLFFVVVSLGSYAVLRDRVDLKSPAGWLFWGAAMILSLVHAIYNHPLTHFNLVLIPLSLVASTILFTRNNTYPWFDPRALTNIFPTYFGRTLEQCGQPFRLIHELVQSKIRVGKDSVASKIAFGVVLAIPFIAIMLALLASADPVFKHLYVQLPDWFMDAQWGKIIGYIIVGILAYVGMSSYAFALLHDYRDTKHSFMHIKQTQDSVIAITVLALVNLVYLAFVFVQFSYLFGGKDLSFLENLTYAQYARQGFAQLVLVTVINIVVILSCLYTTVTTSKVQSLLMRLLLNLMSILTLVIVASAFYRMSLYQDAYGFTHLRIFVHVFELWLGLIIAALMIRIVKDQFPFAKTVIVSAISVYVVLNCVNIDAHIARKNLAASHAAVPMDYQYLRDELSEDAINEKIQATQGQRYWDSTYFQNTHAWLSGEPWQGWNVQKQKAIKAIEADLGIE